MRRRGAVVAGVLAAVAATVVAVVGCLGAEARTPAAASRFLDRFVAADGRVVRHDQGGDTVSEGQAYAMLVAVATGEERRFDRVWRWTRRHLQRDDALLSWSWRGGRVADPQPAADADLDAAVALVRAGRRWKRPALVREGRRIGRAVLSRETRSTRRGPLVVAGPWARDGGVVNPSYLDPGALRILRARRAAGAARGAVASVTSGLTMLPPDWARLQGGRVTPAGPPSGGGAAEYGYDAVRLPLRLAATCDPRSRRLAARLWPLLRRGDPGALPRGLDGAPRGGATAPGLAAAAAAARAAGDRRAAEELLDRADALEQGRPTYFGTALVALARTAWNPACG